MDNIRFDEMTPAEVREYIDQVKSDTLLPALDACSFACLKRTFEKYYGFRPVSTMGRDRLISEFRRTKSDQRLQQAYRDLVV